MNEWTLIDTETDGLYPPIHIIEIAAQRFAGLEPAGKPFQIFLNHGIPIPAEATTVHGYTTQFITDNGINPKTAYSEFRQYADGTPLTAHYLRYDWDMALIPELHRLQETQIGSKGFCSWFLARRALPEYPTHKLDYLRNALSLHCSRPHSASGDVESVCDLFTRVIFPRLKDCGIDSIDRIAEFSRTLPLLKCRCMIQGLSFDEESKRLDSAREEFIHVRNIQWERHNQAESYRHEILQGNCEIPKLLLDYELIEEHPNIQFHNRVFMFTGKMAWGTRSRAEAEIANRGGQMSQSKSVTEDLDYLVLGEDKDKGWTSLLKGGKLTKAFVKRIKDPQAKFRIIREEDFIAAFQQQV